MARIRKKYLVYRKDGDEEGKLVGVFSSRRRASEAVRSECSKAVAEKRSGFRAFIEKTADGTRLVTAPGEETVYTIEMVWEDIV